MEPLVSIIVPVYNAQEFLERCINSVLAQEYTNFELILVDDGSTDNSGAVCDSYLNRDARIRVIHKENTGVSDSRNQALDEAKGEYLQFLDSDDWLAQDATRQLVRSVQNSGCDMVIADFYRVVGETISHKGDIEKDGKLTREEFAGHMMENPADFYYGVLWNKLYRRDIIEQNRLRMDANISWCEDFIFNLEYLRHCHNIYALRVPVCYYVKTKGSLVNSQGTSINNTIRMKLNVFEYYQQFYKEVYDEKSYEEIRFQVYRFLLTYAKDGFVPPSFMPGSRKLGQERLTAVNPEALKGDSVALEYYCYRKLWEKYCEVTAMKNDLSLDEVQVLVYLNQGIPIHELGQLADLTGISRRKLSSVIQKLEKRQMVRRVSVRKELMAARKEAQTGREEQEDSIQKVVMGREELKGAAREASFAVSELRAEGEQESGMEELSHAALTQSTSEGDLRNALQKPEMGLEEMSDTALALSASKGELWRALHESVTGGNALRDAVRESMTGGKDLRSAVKESTTSGKKMWDTVKESMTGGKELRDTVEESMTGGKDLRGTLQESVTCREELRNAVRESVSGKGVARYELLPEAFPILRDLELAEQDFHAVWLKNLSEEEKVNYQGLSRKVWEGVRNYLKG